MKLLLIQDSPFAPRLVGGLLVEAGVTDLNLVHVRRLSDGLKRLRYETFDVAVVDPGPADARGLEVLRRVQESMSEMPVVVLGGQGSHDTSAPPSRTEGALLLESIRRAIECKQAERRLAHLAYHDGLTNLPNRLLLLERITQDMARSARASTLLAVLFLDLDDFKTVNDSWGHAAGDRLLQALAQRLQGQIRASDTLARVGGDEFVVVLPELAQPKDAVGIVAKLQQALATPFAVGARELLVSASIGASFYPADGTTPEVLLRKADWAMYAAKHSSSQEIPLAG